MEQHYRDVPVRPESDVIRPDGMEFVAGDGVYQRNHAGERLGYWSYNPKGCVRIGRDCIVSHWKHW